MTDESVFWLIVLGNISVFDFRITIDNVCFCRMTTLKPMFFIAELLLKSVFLLSVLPKIKVFDVKATIESLSFGECLDLCSTVYSTVYSTAYSTDATGAPGAPGATGATAPTGHLMQQSSLIAVAARTSNKSKVASRQEPGEQGASGGTLQEGHGGLRDRRRSEKA